MKQQRSFGGVVFDIFNVIFMLCLIIITLYPMYYIVMASFSEPSLLIKHTGLMLKPYGFSLEGYKAVMNDKDIYVGYVNTLFYVVVGTGLSFIVTALLAYALSRKEAKYAKYIMIYVTLTMFFSGGMIPLYLVVKGCGLLNTRWAPILPVVINVYNFIIMRTAFLSIPDSLIEAAKIDGASEPFILVRIVVPLAVSTIAVFLLFTGVGFWNSWFNAMIYIKNRTKFPLQLFLREILVTNSTNDMMTNAGNDAGASLAEVIKYSTIVVATVPVLMIYPFLQKYFVNGVMIGAVKG